MGEAIVVNVALTVRVLLVGGFLLILPRITRKGLLFGTYVGEWSADREAARGLLRKWSSGCVKLMVLSLVVGYGISLAGRPLAGNLTGTGVLLVGALGLYLRFYSKARALAPPGAAYQAAIATAPLVGGEPKGRGLARLALGICTVMSLATYAYAIVGYQGMATPLPTGDSPGSGPSFIAIILVPSVNLLISPFLALIALLTASAKRSLRGGSGGHSLEAQNAFRATMTRLLSWAALLVCSSMTVLSVLIINIRQSAISTLGAGVWITMGVLSGVVVLFLFGNLIWIVKRYGQGGSRIERGSADAPLTDGLADNEHWVWGLIFFDRNDPSILVEKRFGLGYAFNYGNRTAILIVLGFHVLAIGLIAVALVGPSIGSG
jgi:hypothetical protein